ncbi:MAG: hypothetical protein GY757_06100, partial [bacterium]|nr:hypothetical protein [bacterium]
CEFVSGQRCAYFSTLIKADKEKTVRLQFETVNPLKLRLNGVEAGKIEGRNIGTPLWYDFWENPQHKGQTVELKLKPGDNHLVVFIEGGRYSGDGFYVYMEPETKEEHGK